MRVTNQSLFGNAVHGLRANLRRLEHAQRVAISGRKIETLSDEPIDGSQVMRIDGQLRDIDQFRRNGQSGTLRLSAENVVVTSMRDLLAQARSLAVEVEGTAVGSTERASAIAQIAKVRDQIVALGNTQVGDSYIFGGGVSTTPPFQPDGTYVGDSTVHEVEIQRGVTIGANHTGDVLFSPAFQALADLTLQLQTGTSTNVDTALLAVDAASHQALALQSEAGSRIAQIKTTSAMLGSSVQDLLDRRDALANADPAQSVLEVQVAQTALERAYSVVARTLTTSLIDFLK